MRCVDNRVLGFVNFCAYLKSKTIAGNRSAIVVSSIGNSQFRWWFVPSNGFARWRICARISLAVPRMWATVDDLPHCSFQLKCSRFAREMNPSVHAEKSPQWLHTTTECDPISTAVLLERNQSVKSVQVCTHTHTQWMTLNGRFNQYSPHISSLAPSFNSYCISFALSESVSISDCLIWCSRLLNFALTMFPKKESIFFGPQHKNASLTDFYFVSLSVRF